MALTAGGGGGGSAGTGGSQTGGGTSTPSVTLTVINPNGGTFSGLLAYQDGKGAWKSLTGSGGTYTFPVADAAGRYGICLGATTPNGTMTNGTIAIFHATLAEMSAVTLRVPDAYASGATVTGSLLGLGSTDKGIVTLSGNNDSYLSQGSPQFSLSPVAQGTSDFIASSQVNAQYSVGPAGRVLIKRGISVSGNIDLGNLDLATDGAAAQSQAITASGLGQNDQLSVFANLDTAQRLSVGYGFVNLGGSSSLSPTAPGSYAGTFTCAPSSVLQSGDLQRLVVTAQPSGFASQRSTMVYFAAPKDLQVALPASLGAPTAVESATTPSPRVTTQWNPLSGASAHVVEMDALNASTATVWIVVMTKGWAGTGGSLQYAQPDLSGLTGWNSAFAFQAGESLHTTAASILYSGQGRYFGLEGYGIGMIGTPKDGDVAQTSEALGAVFALQ